MTRTRKQKTRKTTSRLFLFPIMRYDEVGQLPVPRHLNLGSDGRLYLTRCSPMENPKETALPISLKESFAWYRLGHEYNLKLIKGKKFSEWLKVVEQGLS